MVDIRKFFIIWKQNVAFIVDSRSFACMENQDEEDEEIDYEGIYERSVENNNNSWKFYNAK